MLAWRDCDEDQFVGTLDPQKLGSSGCGHGAVVFARGEVIEVFTKPLFHFLARDDGVNQAMVEEKFGGLKSGRQFGLEHTVQDVPLAQCLLLEPGDYVKYRIRTQRTTLYDASGDCVYDSGTGPC